MRTEVAITIDTEFNIGGALTFPGRFQPIGEKVVDCAVGNRSEGLGFILETLAGYGIPATFFVEALNYHYFGDAPMAKICDRLREAEQDIQLHIHPCWLAYEDGVRTAAKPNDDCAGRPLDEIVSILQLGLAAFERWGVERPLALRTGGFSVDENVYRAMAKLKIPIASNISMTINQPAERMFRVTNGRFLFNGVTEIPLSSFSDFNALGRTHYRALAITACSWPEIRTALWRARRLGIETIVILTHPFEFIKTELYRFERMVRNRVNQERFEFLCAFLAKFDQEFEPISFSDRAKSWQERGPVAEIPINGHPALALARVLENGINDRIRSF